VSWLDSDVSSREIDGRDLEETGTEGVGQRRAISKAWRSEPGVSSCRYTAEATMEKVMMEGHLRHRHGTGE
jgi:hypothetical protein